MEKRYDKEIKAFGQRLRSLRTVKGLSQLDVEIATGIIQADISRIENGLKNIEFFTIVKLAEALDVDLHELFTSK